MPRPSSRTSIRRSPGVVFELDLDRRRTRMAERVDQALPADPVDFVSHRGIEPPRFSFHDDAVRRRVPGRQLALYTGERVFELVRLAARGAEPAHGVAAFLDHATASD